MNAPDAPLPPGMAEFAAMIERYRIDLVLVKRHYLRLAMGLGASLLVIAYNAFHLHATEDLHARSRLAEGLILVHLVLCFLIVAIYGWRLRVGLRRSAPSMRARVMQIVDFVHRWGNLLLFLAATGHGALVMGTLIGLDVFTREGRVLLITLAPTAILIIHGLMQIPTRDRLCALHAATWSLQKP